MTIEVPEGYESVGLALSEALAQTARGKGADRHAEKGEPFSSQLICEIPRRLGEGGECFCLGQAVKKIYESRRLPPERARAELLGAINYLAAAWGLLGGFKDAFGEKPVSAPEDFEFDEARMRESMPGIVPQEEDGSAEGCEIECRRPDGSWARARFLRLLDDGRVLAERDGRRFEAGASCVRAPSQSMLFVQGDFVRYLTPDRGWRCGDFIGEEGDCFVIRGTYGNFRIPKGLVEKAD